MLLESVSLKEPADDNETFAHKVFTLTGTSIPPIKNKEGLPKSTMSLCPECLSIIHARECGNDGKVMISLLHKHFKPEFVPQGLAFLKFLRTIDGYAAQKYTWTEKYKGHAYKTFFIFGMHFKDNYNYDLQRIRCYGVHYSATDGKLYPFCTYNSGYIFRNRAEKQYIESKNN